MYGAARLSATIMVGTQTLALLALPKSLQGCGVLADLADSAGHRQEALNLLKHIGYLG